MKPRGMKPKHLIIAGIVMKPKHLIIAGIVMYLLAVFAVTGDLGEDLPGNLYEHPLIWALNIGGPILFAVGIVWSIVRRVRGSAKRERAAETGPYR